MLPVDIVIILGFLLVAVIGITGLFGLVLPMPFVPTPKPIVRAMVELARLQDGQTVFDLGAGDGAILRYAKRAHPGIRAVGIELSPMIWLLGKLRIALSRRRVEFLCQNAMHVDLKEADVIFLYASPDFLKMLEPKLNRELRRGAQVVSHAFYFPERKAVETIAVPRGFRHPKIYRYVW